MAFIQKLLVNTLSDMEAEDFKKFQRYLSQERDGFEIIPKGRLQNKTREDTVDLMVDSYTEGGAASVTLDILGLLGLHNPAKKLTAKLAAKK